MERVTTPPGEGGDTSCYHFRGTVSLYINPDTALWYDRNGEIVESWHFLFWLYLRSSGLVWPSQHLPFQRWYQVEKEKNLQATEDPV
jgi:hypothetical protein